MGWWHMGIPMGEAPGFYCGGPSRFMLLKVLLRTRFKVEPIVTWLIEIMLNLSDLQRRFPWAGGYTVAPATFLLARKWGDSLISPRSPLRPLLTNGVGSTELLRSAASSSFIFHFLRRLFEVFVVNDYCGSFEVYLFSFP